VEQMALKVYKVSLAQMVLKVRQVQMARLAQKA
jgi:hypothetical protein